MPTMQREMPTEKERREDMKVYNEMMERGCWKKSLRREEDGQVEN